MKLMDGGGGRGGGGGEEEGKVVVVGVKFDKQSRELLTWALVKVARPGDRVVALHVLSSANEEEQSTLLALVKTFDSVLSVYEGFCHLKQVDLKLKVSRGLTVGKILVREANRYPSAVVIVGASKALHMIRSPVSVAKYCAKKLSHSYSVIAVDNGKTVFRREASSSLCSDSHERSDLEGGNSNSEKRSSGAWKSATIRRYFGCGPKSLWKDYSSNQLVQESDSDSGAGSPLALVSCEKPESRGREVSAVAQQKCETKRGWLLLRRALLPKQPSLDRALAPKTSRTCRISSMPLNHSPEALYSDVKHGGDLVRRDETLLSLTNSESSASTPSSSEHGLSFFAKDFEGLHEKYSSKCGLYSYDELESATSNFSHERLIGKGGSSQVFRGTCSNGQEVAVKMLKPSKDALREFTTEIEIITEINHKNIISLFGYCFEANNPILVYNYLPRGSLEENLHGIKDVAAFGWAERYNVALGVAEALNYLHNESSRHVIHRDVKSSNILLSCEFEPQLADFGLASWASDDSSCKVYADVAGTFGYLAPEYFMHGKVTEKIDVYAFGVILLELLSGRKPIDNGTPNGPQSLVVWASRILQDGKISQLLDPSMSSEYDHDQLERMALAATLCIRRAPQSRPGISIILKLLQGDVEVTTWAKQQVEDSTVVNTEIFEGETTPPDIQSILNVAFLDMEDDSISISSPEQNISLEEYLQGRWSRSASFH
ncbi:kinase STUNTED-like protein [Drosera capensis]